jgi:hypothetical protein
MRLSSKFKVGRKIPQKMTRYAGAKLFEKLSPFMKLIDLNGKKNTPKIFSN